MIAVLDVIWHGLRDALLMAWEVWWALVLGFAISAIVQAWVPRERIQGLLGGSGPHSVGWATALGAASSSCSYAAVAIGKSLLQRGASAASALAFQFASTNLVWELGVVLWLLIGWRFTVAEYLGGVVMIVLMALLLRLFVSRDLEARARAHAVQADTGHQHHSAGQDGRTWRERIVSAQAWSDVAHNFRGDWQMLYREIGIGFLIAGFVAQLGNGFLGSVFLHHGPAPLRTLENVVVGPLIAMLSFVCSVGNVPVAAVLWSGGISFAGVLSFLFADLVVLPILAIYRKYYGAAFALRITALMLLTMMLSALLVEALFAVLGLAPSGPRPSRADIFSQVRLNHTFVLDVLALAAFAALFALTMRRGARDPVCGMQVDRATAVRRTYDGGRAPGGRGAPGDRGGRGGRGGRDYFFCSEHCAATFAADPGRFVGGGLGLAQGAGAGPGSGAAPGPGAAPGSGAAPDSGAAPGSGAAAGSGAAPDSGAAPGSGAAAGSRAAPGSGAGQGPAAPPDPSHT